MIPFINLPVAARGLMSLWFVFILMLSCVALFRLISQRVFYLAGVAAIFFAVSYIFVQWFSDIGICNAKGLVPPHSSVLIDKIGWEWIFLVGFLLTVLTACLLMYTENWNRKHITASSLKEGIDNLPSGLLWYYDDGAVALRNVVMEKICRQLMGRGLYDGYAFESELLKHVDENNVLKMSDGTVLSVSTCTVESDGKIYHEICAYNITSEYETTRMLAKKQKEATLTNEKLVQYSKELAKMITSGEILAAKVRIHDELGQGLLLARKYLLRGGTKEDKEKLLYVLKKNNTLLEETKKESGRTYLEMIFEAASDMGVKLEVEGSMPEKTTVSDVFTTAIHENLTNTIRHAHGDAMKVMFVTENEKCKAVFTNNGDAPSGPIEERGGLATLRTLVEAAGGEMSIEHTPVYRMMIVI